MPGSNATVGLSVDRELIKGVVHLARHKEFYGHVVQQFEKVFVKGDHEIQTAAVGRYKGDRFIKLYLNTGFFGEMYAEGKDKGWTYLLGVLEHEILHCFPAGTLVSGSFTPIESLKKGSIVVGSDGAAHGAEYVESRGYSGGLVSIKPTGVIGFEVTDNHRVLIANVGWKTIRNDVTRRNVRVVNDFAWKNSQDVRRGDWLAVPRMKGHRSDVEIDLRRHIRGNRWSVPPCIRGGSMRLNEDTAWLMGYYCAEGCASEKSGQVVFSMHDRERVTHGAIVERIVREYVGARCFFQKREGKGSVIVFNSVVMARMLHAEVGRHACDKRVPDVVFWNKDDRILKAFLRGYFDGDGAVSSRSFAAATVSRVLAFQIQAMTARLGVWMNMFFDRCSSRKPLVIVRGIPRKMKDQYRLYSGGDEIRTLLGYEPVEVKSRKTKHWMLLDEFILVRVEAVSRRQWSGIVYNLRSPTRDYAVHNVVVHNCVFGHLFVRFEDRMRGNVAKDLVVNSVLPEDTLPGKYVHPSQYGFEPNKSAMWYYTHLRDNATYKKQCAQGAFGVGGVLSHIMSSHKMWDDVEGDMVDKEFMKDVVRKAQDLCGKNYGNIPGEVVAQIDELLKKEKAIVPWGKVLRMFVSTCQESILDYTVKRISRRFATRPGTRKGDVLNLAVAVDTSGSISDEQLKLFFNEIRWVWKNGAIVTVFEADCQICAEYRFKGKFTGKVHGRGGTDLEPVLKKVEGKYDALIYFTDFYAPEIKTRYRIPILWVLTTELEKSQYPYKWGRFIKIEDGRAIAA